MDCTNDKPCGKATRGPHSAVCVKATAQGLKAKHVATLEGKNPAKLAQLPDGSVLVAQADAAPLRIGPGGAAERLDVGTGLAGCACGAQVMSRAAAREEDWPVVDGVVHRMNLPCIRLEPERAGREGDQALPEAGAASVFSEVRRRLDEREATGVRRYGRSLETFNGRDACRDLEDELLDGLAYATQVRLEQAAIVEALLALASVVSTEVEVSSLVPVWAEKTRAALALAEKLEAARGR